jgi:hypothetical protein
MTETPAPLQPDDCRASTSWGEQVVCLRCALAKDKDDPAPLVCKPVTLRRIIDACNEQAQKIETGQSAAKHAGYREFAHHGEMERAQLLRASARLIAKILSDDVLRSRLLKPAEKPETK